MTAASNSRGSAAADGDQHALRYSLHRTHRQARGHLVESHHDRLDIVRRSAGDGAPGRRAEHRQHSVVVEEDKQIAGRIAHRVARPGRPHRGDQRRHEVVDEVLREAVPVEERREGFVLVGGLVAEQASRGPVEPLDLGQHRQIAAAGQRRPGREQAADAPGAGVLQPAVVVAHRHRHVGLLGGDTEVVEQPAQRRVGAVVVDQEGAVDADDVAVAAVEIMGVRVPPDPGVRLEQRDSVAGRQHVCRRQPGNPTSDDGDRAPAWLRLLHIRYSEPPPPRMGARSRAVPSCARPRPALGPALMSAATARRRRAARSAG